LKQFIKKRGWVYYARTNFYPSGVYHSEGGRQSNILMHRLIMGAPDRLTVDHIDGDGLNNTRSNLRLATDSQNGGNMRVVKSSSGFKGVSWNGTSWVASFTGGPMIRRLLNTLVSSLQPTNRSVCFERSTYVNIRCSCSLRPRRSISRSLNRGRRLSDLRRFRIPQNRRVH
jgi:hypothetical protein